MVFRQWLITDYEKNWILIYALPRDPVDQTLYLNDEFCLKWNRLHKKPNEPNDNMNAAIVYKQMDSITVFDKHKPTIAALVSVPLIGDSCVHYLLVYQLFS